MTLGPLFRLACVCLLVSPTCSFASTFSPMNVAAEATEPDVYSSSASTAEPLPDAPSAAGRTVILSPSAAHFTELTRTRPFSAVAMMVNIGTRGIGVEVATPLSQKFNLRAGASFFNYSPLVSSNGFNINGQVNMRNASASVDYYPWGGKFRISPGVTFYNGNKVTATALTAAGQTFTLNDTDYTSSTSDPVTGKFNIALGQKFGPSLTAGFGNMLPRRAGKHWSMPTEFGFVYVGAPKVTMSLSGTACQAGSTDPDACGSVSDDADTQANMRAEQASIRNTISPLRFYPIFSTGLAFKF